MTNDQLEKTVSYWIKGAEYDLDTAERLLEVEKYPYVLFFGHLALEKLLKALFVKINRKHAPYTHRLTFITSKLDVNMPQEILDKMAEFEAFNIEARYPDEKKSFYDICDREFAKEKLRDMKGVYEWFQRML